MTILGAFKTAAVTNFTMRVYLNGSKCRCLYGFFYPKSKFSFLAKNHGL